MRWRTGALTFSMALLGTMVCWFLMCPSACVCFIVPLRGEMLGGSCGPDKCPGVHVVRACGIFHGVVWAPLSVVIYGWLSVGADAMACGWWLVPATLDGRFQFVGNWERHGFCDPVSQRHFG